MISLNVTVAIPSFNSEPFLIKTVESILAQTKTVDEIVIIDDCSTDKSYEIACGLSEKYNNIKAYKNDYNQGYARNWNKCLQIASNNLILILHSDDILKPTAIEMQLNYIANNSEFALVGGQEDFIDEDGNLISSKYPIDTKIFKKGQILEFVIQTGSYIPCSSVMFNMQKIQQVGFFNENYLATDELFWSKVLNEFPIAVMGESLINRRIHSGQAEYSDFANKFDELIESAKAQYQIAIYEKESFRQNATLKILKRKMARNSIRIAQKVFQMERDITTSFKYLSVAFKEDPKIFLTKFFIKFTIKAFLGKIH
jgi:glycosyltransferase involved in cell wall biosynthesis